MIRRNQKFMNRVNVLLDFSLIVLSYIFSSWLWLDKLGGDSGNMAALDWHTVLLSGVYALFILLLMTVFGFYNTTRSRRNGKSASFSLPLPWRSCSPAPCCSSSGWRISPAACCSCSTGSPCSC